MSNLHVLSLGISHQGVLVGNYKIFLNIVEYFPYWYCAINPIIAFFCSFTGNLDLCTTLFI